MTQERWNSLINALMCGLFAVCALVLYLCGARWKDATLSEGAKLFLMGAGTVYGLTRGASGSSSAGAGSSGAVARGLLVPLALGGALLALPSCATVKPAVQQAVIDCNVVGHATDALRDATVTAISPSTPEPDWASYRDRQLAGATEAFLCVVVETIRHCAAPDRCDAKVGQRAVDTLDAARVRAVIPALEADSGSPVPASSKAPGGHALPEDDPSVRHSRRRKARKRSAGGRVRVHGYTRRVGRRHRRR